MTPEDLKAFLDSIPDDAENAVDTDTRFTAPFGDRYRAERPDEVFSPYDPTRFDRMEQPD